MIPKCVMTPRRHQPPFAGLPRFADEYSLINEWGRPSLVDSR
jgi:hypothetical protein